MTFSGGRAVDRGFVFSASYTGHAGILATHDGVTEPIIQTGDSLFGSTVSSLMFSPEGVDSSGMSSANTGIADVAFIYVLANGQFGVAMAVAVPEPSTLGLSCLLLFAVVACRRDGRRAASRETRETKGDGNNPVRRVNCCG